MKSCNECRYAVGQDTGYSNYTVMGTDFICLLNKNPNNHFDIWYGEAKELNHAEQCDKYTYSDNAPACFDVDGDVSADDAFDGDSELVAMWENGDY